MTDAELDVIRERLTSSRKYYDRMTIVEADQLARDINAVLAEVDRLRAALAAEEVESIDLYNGLHVREQRVLELQDG